MTSHINQKLGQSDLVTEFIGHVLSADHYCLLLYHLDIIHFARIPTAGVCVDVYLFRIVLHGADTCA